MTVVPGPRMPFGMSVGCKMIANLAGILAMVLVYGPIPVISFWSIALFLVVTVVVRYVLTWIWRIGMKKDAVR